MRQIPILITILSLLAGVVLAQEREASETEPRQTEATEPQSRQRERGMRAREQMRRTRKLEVKDPGGFKSGEKPIFSGPQPGEKLPAFKSTILAGDRKGDLLDPVSEHINKPQILIFQDESGVAARGLYGVVDSINKIRKRTDKKLNVAVIFLSDDAEKIQRYNSFFPKLLSLGIDSITMSPDGRNGPGAYGLDRNVSQTIILAKDGKVTRNFVFPQGLLYADPHVMGGIAELIETDREKVATWLAEPSERDKRMAMRRGGSEQTPARAFRQKLGEFVRAGKISREEAAELFQIAFPQAQQMERDRR